MKKKLFALCLALSLALSLAACGGKTDASGTKDADLNAFYETLTADEEVWPAMMELEGETLDGYYPGLSDVATKQCIVYAAAISSIACEIALVEVEDSGSVETVEDIFQARIDYQVGDGSAPGGAFYPETMEQWEQNSRIVSNGNFVMLAVCEDADAAVEQFNALFA